MQVIKPENEMNFSDLQQALDERKKAQNELEQRAHESDVLKSVAVERELKMIELKKKIAELEAKLPAQPAV